MSAASVRRILVFDSLPFRPVRLFWLGLAFYLLIPTGMEAQVKISLPAVRYAAGDQIRAHVENTGKTAVTICIDIGRYSVNNGQIEDTPMPFEVEKDGNRKWGMLLAPDDIGFDLSPDELGPGESVDFPFRLLDEGKLRLKLQYWRGSITNFDCNKPPKRAKVAISPVFFQSSSADAVQPGKE